MLVLLIAVLGANAFTTTPITTSSRRPTLLHERHPLKIVFSDVDGSLVHYENSDSNTEDSSSIVSLPPSATGMKGVISHQTLQSCRDLRRKGIKLVLVSGMRTSTLLNRLPYLPKADAYCSEAGGRIFYPTETDDDNPQQWTPLEYKGADPDVDLQPFGLREDKQWRQQMEAAAGSEGYAGNEVFSERCDLEDDDEECLIDYENPSGFPMQKDVVPNGKRQGALWEFARELQKEGLNLDTKSYSTCFRVNQKHQSEGVLEKFQELLEGERMHPEELAKSTNLGCIDIYPISSGKQKCCQYLAQKRFHADMATETVCICDDDNDLEMARACSQAYVPALTSGSMERAIQENPKQFTQTFPKEVSSSGTKATDKALELILKRVVEEEEEQQSSEEEIKSIPVEWKSKEKSSSKKKSDSKCK